MFIFLQKRKERQKHALYIRNFIFGAEDSLVSTVGLLSGIAMAGVSRRDIILTGIVLIFVEAFSMGVGSILSEHTVEEYEKQENSIAHQSLAGGLIMFISYFIAGFVPLAPYLLFDRSTALAISILPSLIALFLVGFISAKMFRIRALHHALEMFILGGAAIMIGVIIGKFVENI